ncbi:hypothetical protein ABT084_11595 [Streptomyces sp. NPDC002138]|uniref:hypothetical protein n=1 Tax=Streptomyces sp. NPDC002138 TaxID=3154410 RepID=UPI003321D167
MEWSKNTLGPGKVTVTGGGTNAADIREYQWALNHPVYNQKAVPAAAQDAVTLDINPDNSGPNVLYVRTVNQAGNISTPTTYLFYVRPKAGQDKTNDATGDGYGDTFVIDGSGDLRIYAGDKDGDIDAWMPAATDAGRPVPSGYWKDAASGKSALITHSTDWFPGDGLTDLIARMPDGKLYVYPGDGNGRVDISRRLEILLPAGSPNTATLTQLIAGEDVTGDGMPDFFALGDNGDTFWAFTGYTGASFSTVNAQPAPRRARAPYGRAGNAHRPHALLVHIALRCPFAVALARARKTTVYWILGTATAASALYSGYLTLVWNRSP